MDNKTSSKEFEKCPVCGFPTLGQRATYEICSICNWEDDGQDDIDADTVKGGPNLNISLTKARQNYKESLDAFGEGGRKNKKQNKKYIVLKKKLIDLYINGADVETIKEVERELLICPQWKPNLP